jgi:hypothetical protein
VKLPLGALPRTDDIENHRVLSAAVPRMRDSDVMLLISWPTTVILVAPVAGGLVITGDDATARLIVTANVSVFSFAWSTVARIDSPLPLDRVDLATNVDEEVHSVAMVALPPYATALPPIRAFAVYGSDPIMFPTTVTVVDPDEGVFEGLGEDTPGPS